MKNILSYSDKHIFKGSEIKEWIVYHTTHETSLSSEARKMQKFLNIDDDGDYFVTKGDYQASSRGYRVVRARYY